MEIEQRLTTLVFDKSDLKQTVYQATKNTFEQFRQTAKDVVAQFTDTAH